MTYHHTMFFFVCFFQKIKGFQKKSIVKCNKNTPIFFLIIKIHKVCNENFLKFFAGRIIANNTHFFKAMAQIVTSLRFAHRNCCTFPIECEYMAEKGIINVKNVAKWLKNYRESPFFTEDPKKKNQLCQFVTIFLSLVFL